MVDLWSVKIHNAPVTHQTSFNIFLSRHQEASPVLTDGTHPSNQHSAVSNCCLKNQHLLAEWNLLCTYAAQKQVYKYSHVANTLCDRHRYNLTPVIHVKVDSENYGSTFHSLLFHSFAPLSFFFFFKMSWWLSKRAFDLWQEVNPSHQKNKSRNALWINYWESLFAHWFTSTFKVNQTFWKLIFRATLKGLSEFCKDLQVFL